MEKPKRASRRTYLQILISALLLIVFYRLGLPLYFIVFIGLFIVLMMIFKSKLYRALDRFMNKMFPSLSKLKPWAKKLIIVVVFVLVYMLAKQIIFFILEQFGVDVQQMIEGSINSSMANYVLTLII